MKNKVIQLLKDKSISEEVRYNQLLQMMMAKLNLQQVRNFQMGFSSHKLELLTYEAKKLIPITDLEIHNFENEEINENQEPAASSVGASTGNGAKTEVSEQKTAFQKELEANTDAQEGLKLRDEYPFLKDENCPKELLVLVGQKITAWEKFAENRNELEVVSMIVDPEGELTENELEIKAKFEALTAQEKEAALYLYAKKAVENFQLNANIKKELDFYKETGKFLGEHPELSDAKIHQEIEELDEAGLVEMKTKASKNASKARKEITDKGTNEAREKRVKDWELRSYLANKRLETEFPKK